MHSKGRRAKSRRTRESGWATTWGWVEAAVVLVKIGGNLGFLVLFTYAAEAYPSSVRNFGSGFVGSWARIGGVFAPIIGQLLLDYAATLPTFGTFAAAGLVGTLATLALPFDTLGYDADTASLQRRGGASPPNYGSF